MEGSDSVERTLYDMVVHATVGRAKWGKVYEFLVKHPTQVQYVDEYGSRVLHKIVSSDNVPFEVVALAAKTFPLAITLPDYFGRLPLHHAICRSTKCSHHTCTQMFGLLLMRTRPPKLEHIDEAMNGCARRCNNSSIIPLHIIENEILGFIGNPLLWLDSYGDNPLHLMIRNKTPISIIDAYLKIAPEAVHSKTYHRDTPIHTALRSDSSFELIKFLLDITPQSLGETDNCGNTPMHASIIYGSSKATMQLIATIYPAALMMKNEEGRYPKLMLREYGLYFLI